MADKARERSGVQFRHGKFSTASPDSDGLPPSRVLTSPSAEGNAALAPLMARARANPSHEEALRIIDEARDNGTLDVVELLLRHPDAEVRGHALALLEGVQDARVLSTISLALNDPDADVRTQAMDAAGRIVSAETRPVLGKAFADKDMNVRQIAFQNAMHQDGETKMALMSQAVKSSYQDMAVSALGWIEGQPSKATVTLMMDALGHSDPFIREKAHDTLALQFQQDFVNPAQAKGWWSMHQAQYDEHLVLKGLASP